MVDGGWWMVGGRWWIVDIFQARREMIRTTGFEERLMREDKLSLKQKRKGHWRGPRNMVVRAENYFFAVG